MRKVVLLVMVLVLSLPLCLHASNAGPGISPDEALAKLQSGNDRFAAGSPQRPDQDKGRLQETAANGQKPFASVLGCSDSRQALELLFDQGFGDIFVIRVAGNVASTDEIGSIEYGLEHLGTPLLVVLGHTKCGAVTAVVNRDQVSGMIPQLVANIVPAAYKTRIENPSLSGPDLVEAAIKANVLKSMQDVLTKSPIVRELVRDGKAKVVGGIYDISTGRVEWLGEHPNQAALVKG